MESQSPKKVQASCKIDFFSSPCSLFLGNKSHTSRWSHKECLALPLYVCTHTQRKLEREKKSSRKYRVTNHWEIFSYNTLNRKQFSWRSIFQTHNAAATLRHLDCFSTVQRLFHFIRIKVWKEWQWWANSFSSLFILDVAT